jgi:SAM-dependent methyltransferase
MTNTLYCTDFYAYHGDRSLESARVVAPLVLQAASIKSVIDIGCGIGTWLRAFSENGVEVIRGVDGDYVKPSQLYIAPEYFTSADLAKPLNLEDRYDLAVCLEVAEHLDARAGSELIGSLTKLAQLVLFSAAAPGQGGIGHVNEQWPGYWRRLFEARGFKMLDLLRPVIREDRRVEWWYRQNIALFAEKAAISANPKLQEFSDSGGTTRDANAIEWVHINMLTPPHAGVRNLMAHLRPVLGRAIWKRLNLTSAGAR